MSSKISALSSGSPAQAADVFPIARSGNNFKLTLSQMQTLAGSAISDTVANTVTAAGANQLTPGGWRKITDAYSGTCVLWIRVRPDSTSELESWGFGTYEGAACSAPVYFSQIKYDLATDYISVLAGDENNNVLVQTSGSDTFGKMQIDLEDGGTSYFRDNHLTNVSGTWSATYTLCVGVKAEECVIDTNSSAGLWGVALGVFGGGLRMGRGCTLSLNATNAYSYITLGAFVTIGASLSGLVGGNCNITAEDADFDNVTIGEQKTIDTSVLPSGYVGSGGYYVANKSTFSIDGSFHSQVNPDGSGISHLDDCPFVGVVGISDVTNPLDNINGSFIAGYHSVIFYSSAGTTNDLTVNDNSVNGGNIFLTQASYTIRYDEGDFIEISGHVRGGGRYQQYGISQPLTKP